nr:hypothetical protein [Tanacetum cinerariifolium]
ENIDVLRTMMKDLENRGQEKLTHCRVFNRGSGGAGSKKSHKSISVEEGGYSTDGSSRSKSRSRSRSARKHRKIASRKKDLENRGQEKLTHRRVFNRGLGGAGSKKSHKSISVEEGGYSTDGSSRSRSRSRSRSARKHRKIASRKNGIFKSHRSVRSEG